MSKLLSVFLLAVYAALGVATSAVADAGGVVRFATLPKDGPRFPEGIAADAAGRIYVATFDFENPNVVYVFATSGQLVATISLPGIVPLGLEFDRAGNLYLADFLNGNIVKFTPPFNAGSVPAQTFPVCGGVAANCGLNAITFDAAGDLYVSDSFGGNVFKLDLPLGTVTTFVSDELLRPAPPPHGFPPFGANGLAFDRFGNLYIANTADDRILKFNPAAVPPAPAVTVFAESINGADGIFFDGKGRLWVAANQGDEVVALNANGRVVERVGSFEGIGPDLAAKGLLFPASIVLSRGFVYVTNLALPLTPNPLDEPEDDVKTYTVSRFRLPN